MIYGQVVLKSGAVLKNIAWPEDYVFTPTSLTQSNLHKLVAKDGSKAYFVQGDNVDYVEINQ
jgi:hypothetical protein